VAIGGANAGQQIAAGEFAEVVALIRKGLAYANVHTAASGGGEIRGQIRPGAGHD
jgi:CHRD domain